MQDSAIVRLEAAQVGEAAEVLARAFLSDPLYKLVLPEANRRAKALSWLFERVVSYSLLYGQVYATATVEGVACWLPPGQTELTIGRLVHSGLYATPLKMGLPAYRRFDTYMTYSNKLHHCFAPELHWYLWALGVAPASQGRGIGGRLLEVVLARGNAEGAACYLETGVESNIRFYEKHGFRVVEEGQVPGQGLPVWAMLRKGESIQ